MVFDAADNVFHAWSRAGNAGLRVCIFPCRIISGSGCSFVNGISTLPLHLTQIREHLRGRLVALFPVLSQCFLDDPLEPVWNLDGERWWRFFQNRSDDVLVRVTFKGPPIRKHFVQHYAQTPDVRPHIYLVSARLLGRHITSRSDHRSFVSIKQHSRDRLCFSGCLIGEFCDAEVEHLDEIFSLSEVAALTDHDVVWLDVAMHYSFRVRSGKCAGHLHGHIECFACLHRPVCHALAQRHAVDELRGDITY